MNFQTVPTKIGVRIVFMYIIIVLYVFNNIVYNIKYYIYYILWFMESRDRRLKISHTSCSTFNIV